MISIEKYVAAFRFWTTTPACTLEDEARIDNGIAALWDAFAPGAVADPRDFCLVMAKHTGRVLGIMKSCLLYRLIYLNEEPRTVPCPVHKGKWSGIQWGWPGEEAMDRDGTYHPVPVTDEAREWYDAGCRCFMGCGCTTGWQPNEVKA